ncbi:hypothetical protein Clacol_004502 [Clathrus columnatus]|uniref:Octanoyltransferase n=1 Tax=Clathrus columnatus TaxID=1419009 RepID=A0AAV5A6L8_9AGAM|nr:hypothetical protein Clacol_004502 [Clathrus columnatus]
MSVRTALVHVFPRPLPYAPTLDLQNKINELQFFKRKLPNPSHKDILLLLEHRPVYTAGRRQTSEQVEQESIRLRNLGADHIITKRGGQTTYHGPGQVVGYPLFDLSRMGLSISEYICKLQTAMKTHFLEHYGIKSIDSDNTGVFLSKNIKLGSIGVQIRHRVTSHGIAYNVTREPLSWFDQVIACGLADVKAGCLSDAAGKEISVKEDMERFLRSFSRVFNLKLQPVDGSKDEGLYEYVMTLQRQVEKCL